MKKKYIILITILSLLVILGIITFIFLHNGDFLISHTTAKSSLVELNGNVIIPFGEYDEISEYSLNGLRRVKKQNKYGFIDNNTGKIIIPCKYEMAGEFTNKITFYKDIKTGKYGYINKNEQIIVKPIYSDVLTFINGLSRVSIDGVHYGFINEDGKVVIPLEYDFLTYFNSLGYANAGIKNKFSGYIDKNNKRYNGITPDKEIESNYSLFVFNENKKFGVKDKQNNIINKY